MFLSLHTCHFTLFYFLPPHTLSSSTPLLLTDVFYISRTISIHKHLPTPSHEPLFLPTPSFSQSTPKYLITGTWRFTLKICCWGLPWWCSGWESACQCRGHAFEPWSGKIPHAAEQLGPWATITEPVRLEPVLRNKRSRDSERPTHCDEEWPPLAATGESPHTETKTQHSQK